MIPRILILASAHNHNFVLLWSAVDHNHYVLQKRSGDPMMWFLPRDLPGSFSASGSLIAAAIILSQVLDFKQRSFQIFNTLLPSRVISVVTQLSELTGQAIPVVRRISLLIKTIQPDRWNPEWHTRRKSFFSKNSRKKPISFIKLTGLSMVRPASSDFWKAP